MLTLADTLREMADEIGALGSSPFPMRAGRLNEIARKIDAAAEAIEAQHAALAQVHKTLDNETDGDCGLSAESSSRLHRVTKAALERPQIDEAVERRRWERASGA